MTPDRRQFLSAGGAAVAGLLANQGVAADATDDAKKFVEEHEKKVKPLEIEAGIAWWNANITGRDADFKRKEEAQNRIDAALSDKPTFARLKAIKEARDAGELKDPVLVREIDLLYLAYLEKQVEPALLKKITNKANAVEQQFNVFRAKVDGREYPDSQVR